MKKLAFCIAICASTLAVHVSAEMFKWVDNKGKTHYGERVPPEYMESAVKIGEDKISVVGQDSQVRAKNKAHVNKIKNQAVAEQRKLQQEEKQQARNAAKNKSKPAKTRTWCRDRYPNNVKKRTACLKEAEQD